ELRRAAAAARPAEVAAFAEQLWRRERLFGTSLCWGNLRQAEADALAAKLQRLDFAPLPPSEWPLPRVAQVPIAPTGPGVVLVHEVMDPAEENSAVELLFQGGSSRGGDPEQMEALAVLQVLASAISDEFYEELRTREQLGYVVSCRADRNEGVFGLLFQVQGAAKSALEVLERIDAFLETVPELLKAKSEAEVAQLADALAEARLARPQSLLGAAQRVWAEIRSREFRWARPAEEALALKKVRKAQVLEAFDTRVASGGALRRRLVSLIVRRGEKARVLAALAKRNAQATGKLAADGAAFDSAPEICEQYRREVIEDLQAFARSAAFIQPRRDVRRRVAMARRKALPLALALAWVVLRPCFVLQARPARLTQVARRAEGGGGRFDPPADLKPPMLSERSSSGLAWQVLQRGTGSPPLMSDTVVVRYTGWKAETGEIIDSSFFRQEDTKVRMTSVIPGWQEALQAMSPGEKRRLWIPASLGFVTDGMDEEDAPGPAGDLIYDVEFVQVTEPEADPIFVYVGAAAALLLTLTTVFSVVNEPVERAEYETSAPFSIFERPDK
ncbi:unnamed protein product, partial [Effrenium voratum]